MLRSSVRGILRRVERLAQTNRSHCAAVHHRLKISFVHEDDPGPVWPQPDSPDMCACGEELTYGHVVHRLLR